MPLIKMMRERGLLPGGPDNQPQDRSAIVIAPTSGNSEPMSDPKPISYATPIWIASNQVAAVDAGLQEGRVEEVLHDLSGQALTQDPESWYTFAGKQVSAWGNQRLGKHFCAVAELPTKEGTKLSVVTNQNVGDHSVLVAFKTCCSGCSDGPNAAVLGIGRSNTRWYGDENRVRVLVPNEVAFCDPHVGAAHAAAHVINPNHCSSHTVS
ncbi:MAG: hypothetical protein HRT94_08255 [Alphaproteobacteria bacterium]|nr:hypothetical protein [Alphaproteobacteria bacterium]